MSLDILPLSPLMSQLLMVISICIVLLALIFALVILFRNDKRTATLQNNCNSSIITKVPDLNREKVLYGEQDILAEILTEEEIGLSGTVTDVEATAPFVETIQNFMCTELQIAPAIAKRAQQIEISCRGTNKGSTTESYHAELRINGRPVSSQMVSLSPEMTKKIIFVGSEQILGDYIVEVNNIKGSFSIIE